MSRRNNDYGDNADSDADYECHPTARPRKGHGSGEHSGKRTKENCTPWSEEECELLVKAVNSLAPKGNPDDIPWAEVAERVPGRSSKQCREKYRNDFRPNISKQPWSLKEEYVLVLAHAEHGNRWSEIARYLPTRPENHIKNRWNATVRAKAEAKTRTFLFLYTELVESGKTHGHAAVARARELYTSLSGPKVDLSQFEVGLDHYLPDHTGACPADADQRPEVRIMGRGKGRPPTVGASGASGRGEQRGDGGKGGGAKPQAAGGRGAAKARRKGGADALAEGDEEEEPDMAPASAFKAAAAVARGGGGGGASGGDVGGVRGGDGGCSGGSAGGGHSEGDAKCFVQVSGCVGVALDSEMASDGTELDAPPADADPGVAQLPLARMPSKRKSPEVSDGYGTAVGPSGAAAAADGSPWSRRSRGSRPLGAAGDAATGTIGAVGAPAFGVQVVSGCLPPLLEHTHMQVPQHQHQHPLLPPQLLVQPHPHSHLQRHQQQQQAHHQQAHQQAEPGQRGSSGGGGGMSLDPEVLWQTAMETFSESLAQRVRRISNSRLSGGGAIRLSAGGAGGGLRLSVGGAGGGGGGSSGGSHGTAASTPYGLRLSAGGAASDPDPLHSLLLPMLQRRLTGSGGGAAAGAGGAAGAAGGGDLGHNTLSMFLGTDDVELMGTGDLDAELLALADGLDLTSLAAMAGGGHEAGGATEAGGPSIAHAALDRLALDVLGSPHTGPPAPGTQHQQQHQQQPQQQQPVQQPAQQPQAPRVKMEPHAAARSQGHDPLGAFSAPLQQPEPLPLPFMLHPHPHPDSQPPPPQLLHPHPHPHPYAHPHHRLAAHSSAHLPLAPWQHPHAHGHPQHPYPHQHQHTHQTQPLRHAISVGSGPTAGPGPGSAPYTAGPSAQHLDGGCGAPLSAHLSLPLPPHQQQQQQPSQVLAHEPLPLEVVRAAAPGGGGGAAREAGGGKRLSTTLQQLPAATAPPPPPPQQQQQQQHMGSQASSSDTRLTIAPHQQHQQPQFPANQQPVPGEHCEHSQQQQQQQQEPSGAGIDASGRAAALYGGGASMGPGYPPAMYGNEATPAGTGGAPTVATAATAAGTAEGRPASPCPGLGGVMAHGTEHTPPGGQPQAMAPYMRMPHPAYGGPAAAPYAMPMRGPYYAAPPCGRPGVPSRRVAPYPMAAYPHPHPHAFAGYPGPGQLHPHPHAPAPGLPGQPGELPPPLGGTVGVGPPGGGGPPGEQAMAAPQPLPLPGHPAPYPGAGPGPGPGPMYPAGGFYGRRGQWPHAHPHAHPHAQAHPHWAYPPYGPMMYPHPHTHQQPHAPPHYLHPHAHHAHPGGGVADGALVSSGASGGDGVSGSSGGAVAPPAASTSAGTAQRGLDGAADGGGGGCRDEAMTDVGPTAAEPGMVEAGQEGWQLCEPRRSSTSTGTGPDTITEAGGC